MGNPGRDKQPEVAAFLISLSSPDPSVPAGASVRPPSLCSLLSYPFPIIFISSFELNHIFGVFLKFINPVSLKSQKEGTSERQPDVAGAGAGKARAASLLTEAPKGRKNLLCPWLPCFDPLWQEGVVAKTFFWHSSHHSGQQEVELYQKQAQAIPFCRLDLMSQRFHKFPKQHQVLKHMNLWGEGLFTLKPCMGLGRILSSIETNRRHYPKCYPQLRRNNRILISDMVIYLHKLVCYKIEIGYLKWHCPPASSGMIWNGFCFIWRQI